MMLMLWGCKWLNVKGFRLQVGGGNAFLNYEFVVKFIETFNTLANYRIVKLFFLDTSYKLAPAKWYKGLKVKS